MFDSLIQKIVDAVCARVLPEIEALFLEQEKMISAVRDNIIQNANDVAKSDHRIAKISKATADAVVDRFNI